MFKKHMTPLKVGGSKASSLDNSPDKGSMQRTLPGAATGGGPASTQAYGKATPMAQPQAPAPAPDGLGSGSWSGNGIA
jgi:hypothetical protein